MKYTEFIEHTNNINNKLMDKAQNQFCFFFFWNLQLDLLLITKRYISDVKPSYVSIFNLFLLLFQPVGMTEVRLCFMLKIVHNPGNVYWICFKLILMLRFAFGFPISMPNFSWNEVCFCKLQWFLSSVQKELKMRKFFQNLIACISGMAEGIFLNLE